MKCKECTEYRECVKHSNLAIKRKSCPKAKAEKQLTNADRIRAMTDEQLAVVIMCPKEIVGAVSCEVDVPCVECCQKWLKQPAEVE